MSEGFCSDFLLPFFSLYAPGSYSQGHDQVWEALGHPTGGVTGLTNPPLSASSQLLPNVSSKTPRLATCWQPISWDSVYAGPLLLISLVVNHNLPIKSHSKCSLLLSGKVILGLGRQRTGKPLSLGGSASCFVHYSSPLNDAHCSWEKSFAIQGVPAFPVLFPRFIDEESKVLRFNLPQIDH